MADFSPIREERIKQVYAIVRRAGDAGATIQEVAKALPAKADGKPMTVTPYLTGMLDELVAAGWLRKEQSIIQTNRGARMGWRFVALQKRN